MHDIQYPLLLDGGLSNELERLGYKLDDQLWTSHLLDTNPDSILQAHLNFLRSGAKCITTAGYQASIPALLDYGHTKNKALEIISRSVTVAQDAKDIYKSEGNNVDDIVIAASIGSYGAYLADGSEYVGKYKISTEGLKDFHLENIKHLSGSGADILAFETMPNLEEVKVICEIIADLDLKAWISFTIKDQDHISDGTSIKECALYIAEQPNIIAIGANCFSPKHVLPIIRNFKADCDSKKVIVYPNKGLVYDAVSKGWTEDDIALNDVTDITQWINEGADIIGGCCGVGCDEIYAYSKSL